MVEQNMHTLCLGVCHTICHSIHLEEFLASSTVVSSEGDLCWKAVNLAQDLAICTTDVVGDKGIVCFIVLN